MADGTRRIGVTLHHSSQAQHKLHIASIADAIGRVAMGTDAIVRFIPHFRGPADRWSDLATPAIAIASVLLIGEAFLLYFARKALRGSSN